jgi:hypothetical protein
MADAIIRADGLTKNYAGGVGGDVLAVDDIELGSAPSSRGSASKASRTVVT